MARGFILDLNRCTGCEACRIACTIENRLEPGESWRRVRTFNPRGHPAAPRFHLSLACNHCDDPPCVAACPALACAEDPIAGVVVLDPARCIGCRYCAWACPYDAPVYDSRSGEMSKCTLCLPRLREGRQPACVALCPTGALQFDELGPGESAATVPGFPRTNAGPAIRFTLLRAGTGIPDCETLSAIDLAVAGHDPAPPPQPRITPRSEWPLLAFTLLAPALVALWTASLVTTLELDPPLFFSAIAAALGVGAVHLGRRARAWRAALNLRRSWLSREVALYLAFALLSALALLVLPGHPLPGWAAALAGFGALYSMDRLYDVTLVRGPWRLHSADAALTGLLAAGLLAGSPLPSLLAGTTKLFLYLGRRTRNGLRGRGDAVRGALRLGLGLLFPTLLWVAGPEGWLTWALTGLAAGECIDRWEFYREIDLLTPERQLAADLRSLLAGRLGPAR